jgi:DNA-binding NarL/FixJ family response regulator
MSTNSIHVLLVDDHALFRKAMGALFRSFNLDVIYKEASSGKECLEILTENPVDVILLDVQMPLLNGMETLKKIRKTNSKVRVVILTQFDEPSLIVHMLHLGANGFLIKNCEQEELKKVIVGVHEEGYYYDELVLKVIGNAISKIQGLPNLEISAREFQVITLLKEGNSSKEIARILKLTLRTVESYRKALMKKTKCRSAAEVVGLAYRTGLVAR